MKLKRSSEISDYRTVLVSTLVSLGDIIINLTAAVFTGSSVMISQGLQGIADFTTTVFLLIGVRRSKRQHSKRHPFGYGRELFFWVFLSSLIAFLFSGGVAISIAIRQLIQGYEIDGTHIALLVLVFGLVTNGYALNNSLRRLSKNYRGKSVVSYLRYSSLIETKMTLLVDLMGTLSALLGIIALVLFALTNNTIFDAIGALLIGLMTSLGALIVIVDLYDLIIGRSPHPNVIKKIKDAATSSKGVQDVIDIRATTMGSEKLFIVLEIHFEDNLNTDEIEDLTDRIQTKVMKETQQDANVVVEVESPS